MTPPTPDTPLSERMLLDGMYPGIVEKWADEVKALEAERADCLAEHPPEPEYSEWCRLGRPDPDADRCRLELCRTVLGWIVEERPAMVHSYVMGHYALDPIHDLPMFLREFPAVDLEGWLAKHGDDMDKAAALAAQEKL